MTQQEPAKNHPPEYNPKCRKLFGVKISSSHHIYSSIRLEMTSTDRRKWDHLYSFCTCVFSKISIPNINTFIFLEKLFSLVNDIYKGSF